MSSTSVSSTPDASRKSPPPPAFAPAEVSNEVAQDIADEQAEELQPELLTAPELPGAPGLSGAEVSLQQLVGTVDPPTQPLAQH